MSKQDVDAIESTYEAFAHQDIPNAVIGDALKAGVA